MRRDWKSWWAAAILLAGAGWIIKGLGTADAKVLGELVRAAWPPGWAVFGNMSSAFLSLLLGAFLLVLFDACGTLVLSWITGGRPRGAVRASAVFAGYAAFSTFLLGAAANGLWYRSFLAAVPLLLAAALAREMADTVRGVAQAAARTLQNLSGTERLEWFLAGGFLGMLVVLPELQIDCLEYHLSFPQQLLMLHKLIGRHLFVDWTMPLGADLPNVFGVMCGLDTAVKFTRPALMTLGALALLGSLRSALPSGRAAPVILLALAVSSARNCAVMAKNDGVILGVTLALLAVMLDSGVFSGRAPARRLILVGGLLAGFLLACKFVSYPVVAVLGLAVLLRAPWRLAVAAAGVLVVFLPWMVRSWLYMNDPLYPAGAIYLPFLFGDPNTVASVRESFIMFSGEKRPRLNIPSDMALALARNSFILFAALPLLSWRPGEGPGSLRGGMGKMLLWALAGLLALLFSVRAGVDYVERFAYPLFAAGNLVGGCLLLGEPKRGSVMWAARLAVVACAIRLLVDHMSYFPGVYPTPFLTGGQSAAEYRTRGLYGYGGILPALCREDARFPTRGSLLFIGNRYSWDAPGRIIGVEFEPSFIWKAANESPSPERMAVRFRQANVRFIIYNPSWAHWSAGACYPESWDLRMAKTYLEFARRHMVSCGWSGHDDPLVGCCWLFRIDQRAHPPSPRVLFLPGAERTFCRPVADAQANFLLLAINGYISFVHELPGLQQVKAMLGTVLVMADRPDLAYPLLRETVDAGLVYDDNVICLAIASGRLGRKAEAARELKYAEEVYPLWTGKLKFARLVAGLATGKGADRPPARGLPGPGGRP